MPANKELLAPLFKLMIKDYGEGSLFTIKTKPWFKEFVTTGLPSVDTIAGGGLGKGKIVEIFGVESSGKTTLTLHCAASYQKLFPDKSETERIFRSVNPNSLRRFSVISTKSLTSDEESFLSSA